MTPRDPLDDLLAEANETLTPIPDGLVGRIERRRTIVRLRRVAGGTAALAAAVVGIWLVARPVPVVEPPPLARVDPPPPMRARVTVPAGVTAVPVPSDSPNVTVLWLFAAPPPPAERNDS